MATKAMSEMTDAELEIERDRLADRFNRYGSTYTLDLLNQYDTEIVRRKDK